MPDFNAAFRKWFGDSKVVDADGNPLVVYHGTRASFSVFDADIGPDRGGLLAFFSESPKFGAMYSKQGSEEYVEGSNVMPVYLAIQRPFDYRVHWKAAGDYYEFAGGPQDSWELDRLAADHYRVLEEELTDRQRERYGAAQFVKQVKSGSWLPLEIPSFVMYLREQGFDGLRMREMRSVNWGVFEPTQVKSATGNDGTWDADDPDIRSNPATGTCYRDAVQAVVDDPPVGPRNAPLSSFENLTVVHGKARVTDADTGRVKRAGHAWVEFSAGPYWFVFDPTMKLLMDRDQYYAATKAKGETRYEKPLRLIGMAHDAGHWGPY